MPPEAHCSKEKIERFGADISIFLTATYTT
jgi:hypothetical protein